MLGLLTRRQEAELITSLQGRGEIPFKFEYLGEGANNWDKIARARAKTPDNINSLEAELLEKRMSDFLKAFSNVKKLNLIDIGCGNGIPIFPVMDELRRRKISFRYVPLDISKEMLDLAVRNVTKRYGRVESKPLLIDFEQGNFSDIAYELKDDGSSNLFLFLGSTIGNQSDMGRVLTNFRDSMSSDDFLIIGVELTNLARIDKILSHYHGKLVDDLVYYVPESIGISRKETKTSVTWNEIKSQVELRIILDRDMEVKIGKNRMHFEKGEQIFTLRSIKFTSWTLTKLLSDTGFRTEMLVGDRKNSYSLSMVQPTRYTI
ncbi:MAG: L-histidine N(alpha)-methyltransferase [Candidatus Micrarchaeota archaeon]|nr:L-histidine N(alpha)-methyltransferase [Candidatus Micrarchaeota archaeon]MDE1804476.1 L-histidine N(alpha)-methyltransferase [Candidatus Micrarchaeota archaeon]MDE1846635.1 L-histidine N(alpha)-methyltransferase [Candidatus Micrarchaeota archaeon]